MAGNDNGAAALQEMWQSFLRRLECRDLIAATGLPSSRELNLDACRYMFSQLSHAYLMSMHTDANYPQFLPYCGEMINFGGPNPDGVYSFARIDGKGSYRIVGKRNTVRYVDIQTGCRLWGFPDSPGKTFPSTSLDDFRFDADGGFEILLAAQKPADYAGNWLPLNPEADYILLRQFAYDWAERDARLAIERLDIDPRQPRMTTMEVERRLDGLVDYFNRFVDAYTLMRRRAAGDKVNDLNMVSYGVGTLARQVYLEGSWRLAPGEALLCELKLPVQCFYWNVQVANMFWETLNMSRSLSSVNGHQAHTDTDGITRVVFAGSDPGVVNWVDTGGLAQGDIVWRWLKCSASPEIAHRVVPLDRLDAHLPAGVARVSPEQRRVQLRQRAIDAQLRRKW